VRVGGGTELAQYILFSYAFNFILEANVWIYNEYYSVIELTLVKLYCHLLISALGNVITVRVLGSSEIIRVKYHI
jgi:hypothetical protein